jgi:hypothetical protein
MGFCSYPKSSSVVSTSDTKPFRPYLSPYLEWTNSSDFNRDKGVILATIYWQTEQFPSHFTWYSKKDWANDSQTIILSPKQAKEVTENGGESQEKKRHWQHSQKTPEKEKKHQKLVTDSP